MKYVLQRKNKKDLVEDFKIQLKKEHNWQYWLKSADVNKWFKKI